MAKPVGTAIAEIDLDLNKFQKSLDRTKDMLLSTTMKSEEAFRVLGVKSDKTFEMMRTNAQLAFDRIKNSATSSAADITRAQEAMATKIKTLNNQQFGEHESHLTKLKSHWLAASVAIGASIALVADAWSKLKVAADFEEQSGILDNLSKKYKTSADSIIADMERASDHLIAKSDLMQIALSGIAKGLKPEQLINLADAARILGDAAGKNATEALQDLTQALETGRTRGLKNYLETALNLEDEFGELAAKMTATEKAQAMYSLTMISANKLQAEQTKAVSDTADRIEQLEARYKNATLAMGNFYKTLAVGLFNMISTVAAVENAKINIKELDAIYKMGYMSQETYEKKKAAILAESSKATKDNKDVETNAYQAQIDLLKKQIQAREDAAAAAKEGANAAKQAVEDFAQASSKLDMLMAGNVSDQVKALARIEATYKELKPALKGHTEELVKLEQWRADSIKALYAQEDKETVNHFINAAKNYDAGYEAIAREIEEGVKETTAHLKKWGVLSEEEQWAQNADDAIAEIQRFITIGSDLGDQWRSEQAQANDTFFGGFKAGFDDLVKHQYTTYELGKSIFRDFHDAMLDSIGDIVDAFIRGEETKKSTMQIVGDSMANLAGDISKKMYAAAIEKIISMIGAYIGEGAAASSAMGSMTGGFAGAMVQIGLYLGTAVAAMLAGKGMASAFKAEGGWVASHPDGGVIRGGSGVRDDVYLGMTPGVRHWGMGGEFVINKDSSAKYARLLTAINRDRGHDDGGPINDSWQPLADMLVLGTLASAGHGFWKGGPFGAIAEAVAFNAGAIGGAFGGKALAGLFAGHAEGGPIRDVGHLFGIDIIDPFGWLPGGRNSPIPNIPWVTTPPEGFPDPLAALRFATDPEAVLELIRKIIEEPYKQIAKDILTPNKMWSNPIDAVGSAIDLLREVVKAGLGMKHSGGVIGADERMILAQTGEGIVSRAGMENLGRLNMGYQGGGAITDVEWLPAWANADPAEAALEMSQRQQVIALVKSQGDAEKALAMERWDELQAMHESLRGIQEQIWWEEDRAKTQAYWAEIAEKQLAAGKEAREWEIKMLEAQGDEVGALALKRAEELKEILPQYQAIQRQIWAIEDAKEAEEALTRAREEAAAAAQVIASRRYSLQERLAQAQGKEEAFLLYQRQKEMAELTRTQDFYSVSLLMQIYAAEDAAKAAEDAAKAIDALNEALGKIKAEDFATSYAFRKAVGLTKVRGYQSGGYHPGGWRMVGEGGPEIEWTGPSNIFSNGGSGDPLGTGELVVEVRAMRQELFQLNWQVAVNTGKTAKLMDRWEGEGLPDNRTDLTSWGN